MFTIYLPCTVSEVYSVYLHTERVSSILRARPIRLHFFKQVLMSRNQAGFRFSPQQQRRSPWLTKRLSAKSLAKLITLTQTIVDKLVDI